MTDTGAAIDPADAWAAFHARWSRLRPPLRADADVVAEVARQIAGHEGHVLLLGVTPELSGLGRTMTAVDWSPQMVAHIWRGDSDGRRALLADWRALPAQPQPCTAAIGDGSLATLRWPDDYTAVFARFRDVLAPGARLAIRGYLTPDDPETLGQVRDATLAGDAGNFHALKWRVAMALAGAGPDPNVAVAAIRDAFDQAFPDRARLAEATGWPQATIDEIDAYRDSPAVYSFVTRDQMRAAAPPWLADLRFVPAGSYPLADRCPLIVADFRP
ncbi:MAG: class I SAM-dependent methyltransferase [Alphaproteobacteria bacterium]|nr:class I SAM-dependent methyltransferase [Alphaproteobacteria bacterium]